MSVFTRCAETTGPIASICSRRLTQYNIIMHVTCGGATYIIFFSFIGSVLSVRLQPPRRDYQADCFHI